MAAATADVKGRMRVDEGVFPEPALPTTEGETVLSFHKGLSHHRPANSRQTDFRYSYCLRLHLGCGYTSIVSI